MANFKQTKRLILLALLLCCVFFFTQNFTLAESLQVEDKKSKYQEIYDNLAPCDFSYVFNLDPYQSEDYTKYMYAPYPLFRTAIRFVFKDTVIEPGYYLLTPREKNGKDYVLFKTNGRVKYIIPVYEKDLVEPLFYEQYVPERKLTWWQGVCKKTRDTVGRLFPKSTQRMPPPKSYIDVNELDGDFMQIVLYYGATKYYMIFMR